METAREFLDALSLALGSQLETITLEPGQDYRPKRKVGSGRKKGSKNKPKG